MPNPPQILAGGRGRPRDPRKDQAIRDAAWDVLAEHGYEGLTFEAVAETAGCSRATLYRRFAGKFDLIAAMLYETSREVEPQLRPDTCPHAALRAHIDAFVAYMSGKRGRAIGALNGAIGRAPELRRITQAHKIGERDYYYAAFRSIAPQASEAHMAFVFDTLIGIFLHHTVTEPRDLSSAQRDALIEGVVNLLLLEV